MSAKIEILSEGKTVIQPEDLYRVSSLHARMCMGGTCTYARWSTYSKLTRLDKMMQTCATARFAEGPLGMRHLLLRDAPVMQAEVEIHEDAAGTVIGKGGTNIARLQVWFSHFVCLACRRTARQALCAPSASRNVRGNAGLDGGTALHSFGLPQKDHMIAIDLEKSKGSGGAVKGLLIGQKANVEKAKKEIEEISVRFCLGGAPT